MIHTKMKGRQRRATMGARSVSLHSNEERRDKTWRRNLSKKYVKLNAKDLASATQAHAAGD
jgi:hypothetical protein